MVIGPNSPLSIQQFLIYQCYLKLGMMELALQECQTVIKISKNEAFRINAQLDYCMMAALTLDWKNCIASTRQFWISRTRAHQNKEATEIDLKIGLFCLALQTFQPSKDNALAVNYIRDVVMPILLENDTEVSDFN